MKARKCDICGSFYISDLESKVTCDLKVPVKINAQAAGMVIFSRTTIIPMLGYGSVEKQLDVCSKCKRQVCFETGKSIRASFGASSSTITAAPADGATPAKRSACSAAYRVEPSPPIECPDCGSTFVSNPVPKGEPFEPRRKPRKPKPPSAPQSTPPAGN